MRHLLLLLLFPLQLFAQQILVTDSLSYQSFADLLNDSKKIKYDEILQLYDAYIAQNPHDARVKLYRCKFMGSAFYDHYEEYDPNWEETDACLEQLLLDHPDDPGVLLYQLDFTYGDEQVALIEKGLDLLLENRADWPPNLRSALYEKAAYSQQESNPGLALYYAQQAELENPSTDLSVLIATLEMEQGNKEHAKEILLRKSKVDQEVWTLNQKANLLVDLEAFDEAFEVFEIVKEKDSSYVDNGALYKILLNAGEYAHAREYLVEDTLNDWNKASNVQRLLEHDMKYENSEVTLITYKRMQEISYYDDFFGIKRLRIFFKDPFGSFSTIGFSHFFWLALLLVAAFLIPYLWILPIYFTSKYFKIGYPYKSLWGLKHFWFISFAYVLIQILTVLLFYYQDTLNGWFGITNNYFVEEETLVQPIEMAFFTTTLFVVTLAFLNKERLAYVFSSRWGFGKTLGMAIGFFIFNLILLNLLDAIFHFQQVSFAGPFLTMKKEIVLLLQEYGFTPAVLIVAIIAPFYEEVIFRGIILNSVSKHIGFVWANVFQATLFALIHFFLPLFLFYFVFGLVTGYMARKTNGLKTGIVFHMVNNFIVVLLLYYVSRTIWVA